MSSGADLAWHRSAAYARLSLPFARSPEPFLTAVATGRFVEGLARDMHAVAGATLEPHVAALKHAAADRLDGETKHRLRVEHARLFVGPGRVPAPPYESIYRTPDRRMMGEAAIDARRAYEEAGVVLKGPPDPPDHLETELQFMALLAGSEAEHIEAERERGAMNAMLAEQRFLAHHLAQWTGPFAADVSAAQAHPIFVAAADLLDAFVTLDQRSVEWRLARVAEEAA